MTVNVIVVVPAFPSETLASSIERRGLSSCGPAAVRNVAASFRGAVDALAKTTGPEQREAQDEKRGQRSASMKSLR